jgi:small basic protein (TIGR04137 family)
MHGPPVAVRFRRNTMNFRGLDVEPSRTPEHPTNPMSIDKSLKRKAGGNRNRSVYTRAERITKMMEDGKWPDGRSPFGLPKTRTLKVAARKKVKKEAAEGDAAATPAAGKEAAKK